MLAVAELVCGDDRVARGSAFAIAPDAALTARHCVFDDGTLMAPLGLVLPGGSTLTASLVDAEEADDIALLALDQPLPPGWDPIPLLAASACRRNTPFLVRGYPADRPFADADRMDGHVVDPDATAFGGVPVVALFSPQVAAPVPRDPHGFSGAPVLVEAGPDGADVAIGLIRWGEVDPTTLKVKAGSVLAAPVDHLAARWREVANALAACPRPQVTARAAPLPGAGAIRSFEAQYLGRPGRPVAFGGRASELAGLDRWITDGDTPRLLLVAPAGTGKSALLVRWLAETDVPAVYVPISLRYELARETQVLRALAARLAEIHHEAAPDGDSDALRDAVAELLSRPAPERLVVVIDGLDEAEGWDPGPALLGGVLGDGVSLLGAARSTASRHDAAAWLGVLGWDARDVTTMTLAGLDRRGVADVLAHAPDPVQRLAGDDVAVDRLMHLTAGDPLVLGLYLGELQRLRPEKLAAAVAELPDEVAGLDEVFGSWWRAQRRQWAARGEAAGRVVWATLDVLACARGPLQRSELLGVAGRLTDIDGDLLDDALRSLDRFVVRGSDGGLALAHPRLGDHRRQRLAADGTLGAARRALLEWCQGVLAAVREGRLELASPYAVRHLGEHLEEAGAETAALMELVDPAWQSAWEAAVDDFNGFAGDVARAQRAARRDAAARIAAGEPSEAVAAAVRCALVGAGVADVTSLITGDLALQLVRHGVWSERRAAEAVLALKRDGPVVIGLGALAPVLGPASLALAFERVAAVDPVGWRTTHGETMGALSARRAQLDGTRAGVASVGDMPGGTGRAVALRTLLREQPDAAGAGATSLLIEELAAIAEGRNEIDTGDVFLGLADSVPATAIATALAGPQARPEVAIAFVRSCIAGQPDAEPPSHLASYELGVLAPWLKPERLEPALTEVVDDVAHMRLRDARGRVVELDPGSGLGDALGVAISTAHEFAPVADRLPPALAARAADLAVNRLTDNFATNQHLAPVIITLAERLPEDQRGPALAPLLRDLDRLLAHGGDIRSIEKIAAGLGRCGHAIEIFRAAAGDEDGGGRWHGALEQAADHLDATSVAEALEVASAMLELYRPWVASRVLARLASFGPREARAALRWATTPAGGREHAAAEALRTADRVPRVPCAPLEPEPPPDPDSLTTALRLLVPDASEPQHDIGAIHGVLGLLDALDIAGAKAVARAVEGVSGVSSRNDMRGPVAVRLARLGALDAALGVPIDPYVAPGYLPAVLRVTPEDRLDDWLATVQGWFGGDIHSETRAELMRAAAARIAACDAPRAWTLLDAWLERPGTRVERLCDLLGYAPAVWMVGGAGAARSLADWIEPPSPPTPSHRVL